MVCVCFSPDGQRLLSADLKDDRAQIRDITSGRLLAETPAATVKAPKILDSAPPLYYEIDELAALYLASSFDAHHPEASQHAPWHCPAWKFMANTGIRRIRSAQKTIPPVRMGIKVISTSAP